MRDNSINSTRAIETELSRYLGGDEKRCLLTPGEPCDWTLQLKDNQTVLAEAKSDVFDPALEIVDSKGQVVAMNDDRYPGEQKPLLFWRCTTPGEYKLRLRALHDKSGGGAAIRYTVNDCLDVTVGSVAERKIEVGQRFFARVPMKKAQIAQLFSENPNDQKYTKPSGLLTISQYGLPDAHLERAINPPIPNTIIAPVDGDYYVLEEMFERGKTVRIGARAVEPVQLNLKDSGTTTAINGNSQFVQIDVKAGQILEVETRNLGSDSQIYVNEKPDFSKFDLSKDETNPFFPKANGQSVSASSPVRFLPSRDRDGRSKLFSVYRDSTLWISSNGLGAPDGKYQLVVHEGTRKFTAGETQKGALTIGRYDYWAFDAQVGEVMTFKFQNKMFSQSTSVRMAADGAGYWSDQFGVDQTESNWKMVVRTPGKYLVGVSCMGNGGGGEYQLVRSVLQPKEFSKAVAAIGTINGSETQVWKLTVKPNEPMLMRLRRSGNYGIDVYDQNGSQTGFGLTRIDDANSFGIVKVNEVTTFLIVLTGQGSEGKYEISLQDIPGYKG